MRDFDKLTRAIVKLRKATTHTEHSKDDDWCITYVECLVFSGVLFYIMR